MKISSKEELFSKYDEAREICLELLLEYTDLSLPMTEQSKYYNALIKAVLCIEDKMSLLDPQDDFPF